MSYTIYKSDGTLITVPDNTIDTAFYNPSGGGGSGGAGQGQGIQLLGRNTVNYGAAIAQNILQSAENFCSSNFPSDATALQGQLWFNQLSDTSGNLFVRVTNNSSGGLSNWQQLVSTDIDGNIVVTGTITTPIKNNLLYGNNNGTISPVIVGSGISFNPGTGTLSATGLGGTVTTISVVSANGFTGTIATPTTTPAITLTTSVTGLLKGNGTAILAAVAGIDYAAPGTSTTFTTNQVFAGSTTSTGMIVTNAEEVVDIVGAAPVSVQTFYAVNGSLQYYTPNAANNWTINFAWSSSTTMNSVMGIGNSLTMAMMVTQGATPYYASAFQIDGISVTPKWQGGVTPLAGNANGVDIYTFTIVKTASATYSVFGALTQYK